MGITEGVIGVFTGSGSRGGLLGNLASAGEKAVALIVIVVVTYLLWKLVDTIYKRFYNPSVPG